MKQVSKGNSQQISNKTTQAIKILEKTNHQVNEILEYLNQGNAGYIKINEILLQIQADIDDATKRTREEIIRIGILGGTGSGKSKLANALMTKDILPESAFGNCTCIPTTIKYSSQYFINVESEVEEYNFSERNIKPEAMKATLAPLCQESQNPNNNKKIVQITIGVPAEILHGKEIVDVPGFTKGNPLHQAIAENYTKYYCDICIVLINNNGSVQINSHGGEKALAYTFQNRPNSTVFILNKCDESDDVNMDDFVRSFRELLKPNSLQIPLFRVSSKNSLANTGHHYEFQNFLGHLSRLSSSKNVIIVKALLERLIANFTLLMELFDLNDKDLDALNKDIKNLLSIEFDNLETKLKNSLCKDEILPNEIPEIEISRFVLPSPIGTGKPYEYAKHLVDSLSSQSNQFLNEYVQQYQAQLYRAFNSRFEERLGEFNQQLQSKVHEFEDKFGISSSLQMPKVEDAFKIANFNPSQIERLKPPVFRRWAEKNLPDILSRDVKFWETPISIKVGIVSFKLALPSGVKRKSEMSLQMQKNIPEQAIKLMNEYLYESVDKFVRELNEAYTSAITQFVRDWRKCLLDYLKQIQIAKIITEPASRKKIDGFVKEIRNSSEEITNLMSQD